MKRLARFIQALMRGTWTVRPGYVEIRHGGRVGWHYAQMFKRRGYAVYEWEWPCRIQAAKALWRNIGGTR